MFGKPKGYEEVQVKEYTTREKPDATGYICVIKKVVPETLKGFNVLTVLFDIAEGNFKDYYAQDFKLQQTNKDEDKQPKWKGTYRIFLPNEEDYKHEETKNRYERSVRELKAFITSVERSNNGYKYGWDEGSIKTLANKQVGIVYGLEEWAWNGKTGWTAKPKYAISVDHIRKGDYIIPKAKPLKGSKDKKSDNIVNDYIKATTNPKFVKDDDLPF